MSGRRRLAARLPAALLTLLLAIALTGCGPSEPLRIAAHPWPGYELMYLARTEGWLADAPIRLLETASASDSLHALRTGAADGAALTLDEVLRARAEGIALQVVLVFDISAGADMVLSRPELTSLSELAGGRIGAETTALGALMLERVLAAAGLERDAVELVSVAVDEHIAIWQQGELDALITYEPTASYLLDDGARRLIDTRALPDTVIDVLAVRTDALRRHHRALEALVHGHFRGLHYLRRNPGDAGYRIGARLGISASDLMRIYGGMKLPGPDANRALLRTDGPLYESAADIGGLLSAGGWLSEAPSLERLTEPGLVPVE